MGSVNSSTQSSTQSSVYDSESREDFKGWEPQNFQWAPDNKKGFAGVQYDGELFKSIYGREPKPEEDVKGLGKAGIVINAVFGLSTPPTSMTQKDCDLVGKSYQILGESDKSIGFALSMTLARIAQLNPQCVNCWKNSGLK